MRVPRCVPAAFARAVTVVLAGALISVAPMGTAAAACRGWTVQLPDVDTNGNALIDVATTSTSSAWAVGWVSSSILQTVIERWNGTDWTRVASPNVGSANTQLVGVAATSTSDAWAVGSSWVTPTQEQTVIEHWNGTDWTRVASPNPGGPSGSNVLSGVAATSDTDAWAVGHYDNGTSDQTLILHWAGTAWTRVPSPNPGGSSYPDDLVDVAAISPTNAWAVGSYSSGGPRQTLIEHWNGTAWKRVASPNPGGVSNADQVSAVTATSATDAWAVGDYNNGTNTQTLIEHWDGTAWKRVASPSPGGVANLDELSDVAATSSTDASAVGDYYDGTTFRTLIVRWNGSGWKRATSPNVGSGANFLFGVSATASTNVWGVGYYYDGTADQALALHRC